MKNRVVITGASGFLGGHLVKKLEEIGFRRLVLIDRKKSERNKKFINIFGSFSDFVLMSRVLKRGDIVVHAACSSIPATSETDRIKDIEENAIGTVKLLDACVKKGASKFIFMSSGGTVYGDHGRKAASETDDCKPVNAHGLMKLTTEKFIEYYGRVYGLKYIIVRPGNFYGRLGDLQRKQGAVDVFLHKALDNQPIEIWGDGDIIRDYIIIEDAVDFLMKAVKKPVQGVFNVGTGRGTTINQVVRIIERAVGRKLPVIYKGKRNFDVPFIVLNSDKARRELGWQPKVDLEEGISRLCKRLL